MATRTKRKPKAKPRGRAKGANTTTPAGIREFDPDAISAVHRPPLRKGSKAKVEVATQRTQAGKWVAKGALDGDVVEGSFLTLDHLASEREALLAVVAGLLDQPWTANAPTVAIAKQRANLVADLKAWQAQLQQQHAAPNVAQGRELQIKLDQLTALPFQPRQVFDAEPLAELAESIAKHGILQRLVVREAESQPVTKGAKRYEIIAGERRYRAARVAKLASVPAIVVEASDAEALELAVVENVERQDLTVVEEGDAFRSLTDSSSAYYQCTQSELAERLGVSQGHIAHRIKLAGLPEPWRNRVMSRDISVTQARMLGPWADYPDVLQAVDAEFRRHRMEIGSLTTDDWQEILVEAVHDASLPVEGAEWDSETRKRLTFKLPADRFDELQVVDVAGRWGKKQLRAFNVKLARKLRKEQFKAARARAKKKGSNGQADKSKPKQTPAEQKARAKQLAEQFRARVGRWRMTWLRRVVAAGLNAKHDWPTRILVHAAIVDEGNQARGSRHGAFATAGKLAGVGVVKQVKSWHTRPDVLGTLAGVTNQALPAFVVALAQALVRESLDDDDVEKIAAGLRIDLAAEWKRLPQVDAELFREFVALHNRAQLGELAGELKVKLQNYPAGKVHEFVDQVVAAKPPKLPKVVAAVKAGKGRR